MLKLCSPFISDSAVAAVTDVLKSGNLVQGRYVREFETRLQEYLGVRHVMLVSSGTAALHLSLMALGIGRGDEVIVPAFTFPATANVVEVAGAKPVLVDIGLNDFCMDAAQIEQAITDRTKLIMPVHAFGQAAEMDKIGSIAERHGLAVVEDAACALGTQFNHQKAGAFGAMACFSFHPRKTISTGEGGAVATNDDELAERIRVLRNHGISVSGDRYDFVEAGLNYRMTDFQAALGLCQFSELESLIDERIEMARSYDKLLSGLKGVKTPVSFENRRATYQTYHVLLDGSIDRDQLIRSFKDRGIETNLGAQAIHCLTYYQRKYQYGENDGRNAVKAFKQGLALPIGRHLTTEDLNFVTHSLSVSINAQQIGD